MVVKFSKRYSQFSFVFRQKQTIYRFTKITPINLLSHLFSEFWQLAPKFYNLTLSHTDKRNLQLTTTSDRRAKTGAILGVSGKKFSSAKRFSVLKRYFWRWTCQDHFGAILCPCDFSENYFFQNAALPAVLNRSPQHFIFYEGSPWQSAERVFFFLRRL